MLGTLVVLYLFLGGCGAGVMFVTAAWSLAFHRTRTRTQEQTAAFGDLKARCYGIGFVMLCLAALCLLLDLGSPRAGVLAVHAAYAVDTVVRLVHAVGKHPGQRVSGGGEPHVRAVRPCGGRARRPKRRAWRCRCA